MELLCPSCQRRLTIPDQYAGQLMKCPLCNNNFTAPALAPVPGAAIYTPPPAAPAPGPASAAPPPVPGANDFAAQPPQKAPALTPVLPVDYTHQWSVWLSPRVLSWVPSVALFLIFVLSFFTWIRIGPSAVPAATQTGWQAAFGSLHKDPDLTKEDPATKDLSPGVNVLLIFYLLLLVLLVVVSVAAVVLPLGHAALPAGVRRLMPWRWALVSGLGLLALLLLVLQLLVGFSLEGKARAAVDREITSPAQDAGDAAVQKMVDFQRGIRLMVMKRTSVVTLVVLLQLLAVLCGLLVLRQDLRNDSPIPRLDFLW
jgi:hypothetical protein